MEESSKKAEVIKESSSKRAEDELQQESTKKQKMDDIQERVELQSLMKVIPDEEEVAVDAIPLATKPPSTVNWKIVKEGKISYYSIIRADGSSRRYSAFIQMLRSFDREDLETLWTLVKAKHGYTRPEEGYERGRIVGIKKLLDDLKVTAVKDHLGKFVAKADDGYFLGYSFVSKAFRVFNTRIQQIKETYHVTIGESMEAIRFTHTSEDEIGIDDSSRYPPDEFVHEDDPSRQYQIDSDISYYVIPHGRSLSELTQDNQVPKVIAPNEPDIPHTKDTEGPLDLINTEGTHKQNVQNNQMITQPIDVSSGNNTKVSESITESLVPDVTQSHISNQASTSSHPVPHDRWSRDQHIDLVNIIGDPGKGMLTRSMAAKLIAASASECLFADFLSKIEPKKVSEVLKHPGWVDAMQEELNQFYRNKV
ncbi:hypothetical protein Tco_1474018 [Tanacetum coccineum]